MHRRLKQRKPRFCKGCGKDISLLPNRAIRCEYCRKKYNQAYINKWKRENIPRTTPEYRGCSRCGKDISDLHYQAEICKECRAWNKKRVDRDYYWNHKKQLDDRNKNYYYNNREAILAGYKDDRLFKRYKKNMFGGDRK